jgi:hypothetical protein
VRKVAKVIDPNMYKILPVDDPIQIPPIEWPKEVQISAVPDWEKMLAMYKSRAKNKRKEENSDEEKTPTKNNEQDEEEPSGNDIDNGQNEKDTS